MTPVLAAWLGGGTGVLGIVTAVIALLKARPEAKKIKADTAKVFTEASAGLVASVNIQMERMSTKIDVLEQKLQERDEREDRQDRRLLVHERWDIDMVQRLYSQGIDAPPPPPLYPDPATA